MNEWQPPTGPAAPDIPNVPDVPDVPDIPNVPDVPDVPELALAARADDAATVDQGISGRQAWPAPIGATSGSPPSLAEPIEPVEHDIGAAVTARGNWTPPPVPWPAPTTVGTAHAAVATPDADDVMSGGGPVAASTSRNDWSAPAPVAATNGWSPPSVGAPAGVGGSPSVGAPAGVGGSPPERGARAVPWWRRRATNVPVWGWAAGAAVVVAVVGFVVLRDDGRLSTADPLPPTAPITASPSPSPSTPDDDQSAAATTEPSTPPSSPPSSPPSTTEPKVESAPPVPPTAPATTPTVTEPDAGPTTTLVVTLPPTTTGAPAPVEIEIAIRFDADGEDNDNRNDEWVRFTNAGTAAVDLTDWIVRDDGFTHAHVFDALVMEPGADVTLYSGCGEATNSERYFCTSGSAVWNNDGDVVSLFDADGVLIAQRRG